MNELMKANVDFTDRLLNDPDLEDDKKEAIRLSRRIITQVSETMPHLFLHIVVELALYVITTRNFKVEGAPLTTQEFERLLYVRLRCITGDSDNNKTKH